jgi:hypothetical protein
MSPPLRHASHSPSAVNDGCESLTEPESVKFCSLSSPLPDDSTLSITGAVVLRVDHRSVPVFARPFQSSNFVAASLSGTTAANVPV